MRAESTSDGLWAADLTRDMQQGKGGPTMAEVRALLNAKAKAQAEVAVKMGANTKIPKPPRQQKAVQKVLKRTKAKVAALAWARPSQSTTKSSKQ